jgi:ribosomal-protein-alanine N-acetyltransferase
MATPALIQPVTIEPGTSEQLDDVMMVMNAAFGDRYGEAWTRSQLAGILPMAGVSLVIARDHGNATIVGFSLFRTVADESELLLLAVAPENQGRGIGRKLLNHFMAYASNDGATRVHLEVRDGNPAVSMYRTAGFSPVGRRRSYYQGSQGDRFDAVTLAQSI